MIGSAGGHAAPPWWTAAAAAGGHAGAALLDHDWAATVLGPLAAWPVGLRAAVSLCLPSPAPMALWWGPDAVLIHNDAYAALRGVGAGTLLGLPGARAWPQAWPTLGSVVERIRSGALTGDVRPLQGPGGALTSSSSPVFDDTGRVGGVLTVLTGAAAALDVIERQRSMRRAEALARLTGALSAAVTGDDIARAVVAHTHVVFTGAETRLGLLDPERAVLEVVSSVLPATSPDTPAEVRAVTVPLDSDDPLTATVAGHGPGTEAGPSSHEGTDLHALTVPLRYDDGGAMGALRVCWDPPVPVTPAGLDAARSVLDTIAGLCGQALQRVQLGEATQQVAQLAARLSASSSTAEAIDAILSAAPRILGARLPSVVLPRDGRRLRLWHHDLPGDLAGQYDELTVDDPRPIAESFRTGQRIIITDRAAFRARYPDLTDTAAEHGLTTTVAVPLLDPRGRPIAAVGMGWSRHRPLRATDMALLDTVTDLCQQTLERTRLAAAEHGLVTRLAGRITTMPGRHPAFDVAVRYQPAITGLNLGGDWYDVVNLSGGRLAVVVGDVVGHQVEAAADMAQLRTVLNTLVRLDTPLGEVFPRVTGLLGRAFLGTALVMIIEPGPELLHLVRAGHPYPLVVPADGTPRVLTTPSAPPLGMVTTTVPVTVTPFGPGDTVAAFTDGLVERRSRGYDEGVDELCGLLAGTATWPVDEIADTVLSRIPGTDDDRALVLVRRRP